MATYSWNTYGGRVQGGFTESEIANLASNLIEHHLSPIRRVRVEKAYDEDGLLLAPHVAARLPKDPNA